jgi:pimeloyl-ACP methyl ester carboxylesterase
MDEESPRWKQLFMYLTQAKSEAELDETMRAMSLRDVVGRIECPTLEVCGEYDPLSPLDEVYELFDRLNCPAELWVFADQHHKPSVTSPNSDSPAWRLDIHELALDWLGDRLKGESLPDERRVRYVDVSRNGPVATAHGDRRHWFEEG